MTLYELHCAVKIGDLQRVSELLSESPRRVDINQPDDGGRTPLMYAVSSPAAETELLRTLIRQGVIFDQTSVEAALGDLQKLTVLIEGGADIRYQTKQGYDALVIAAYGVNVRHNPQLIDILNLLIANGVPLRGMTTYGESAVRVLSRIGRFDAVQFLLKAGANPDDIKFTRLIEAIVFGSLADVAGVVESGADLEERDHWERTPWLFAVQTGDVAKARFLLERGSNKNARGYYGKPALFYAIESRHLPMLKWLLEGGMDIEERDDFGGTALMTAVKCCDDESVDVFLTAGADVNYESKTGTVLSYASTRSIATKLMRAGADPQHLSSAGRRAMLSYSSETEPDLLDVSADQFRQNLSRRFGTRNPETMNNLFWEGMIRSGMSACQAGAYFGMHRESGGQPTPIWCAQRSGQSITFLPDGRIVQVAGEHEDFYDEDFCIYNDVFVHGPEANITIYGYPEAVFPPTDFHTATLTGNYIYLIGSLGYQGTRQYGETPVYRMDIKTFYVERVQTTGNKPGWIYKHRAILSTPNDIRILGGEIVSLAEDKEIQSRNHKVFVLNLEHQAWRIE